MCHDEHRRFSKNILSPGFLRPRIVKVRFVLQVQRQEFCCVFSLGKALTCDSHLFGFTLEPPEQPAVACRVIMSFGATGSSLGRGEIFEKKKSIFGNGVLGKWKYNPVQAASFLGKVHLCYRRRQKAFISRNGCSCRANAHTVLHRPYRLPMYASRGSFGSGSFGAVSGLCRVLRFLWAGTSKRNVS